jgi:transcriptional regulator with XRE-family HTH domain
VRPFNFLLPFHAGPVRSPLGTPVDELTEQRERCQQQIRQWEAMRRSIRSDGGIAPRSDPTEREQYRRLPLSVRRRVGVLPEVAAAHLHQALPELGIESAADLFEVVPQVERAAKLSRQWLQEHQRTVLDAPRAVAPYDPDPAKAAQHAFDRVTGQPIEVEQLKSYRQVLAQYHLHPEAKFAHADYTDTGPTLRRYLLVTGVEQIGKEANRWEEQFHLGEDLEAQTVYGASPEDQEQLWTSLREACQGYGVRELATEAGVSIGEVSQVLRGQSIPTAATLVKLRRAAAQIKVTRRQHAEREETLFTAVREACARTSVRQFAREAGVDAGNLRHLLAGRRRSSPTMVAKLEAAITTPRQQEFGAGCSD